MKRLLPLAVILAVAVTGCSHYNKNEKEADKITQAVIANNMAPVINDFDSQARATVTRIAVARLSDQLNQEGKYQGIKEDVKTSGPPNTHYFEAKFDKHTWFETMALDDDGKVRSWNVHEGP